MAKRADGAVYDEKRKPFANGTVCPPEEDKTRQEEKDLADVNVIVKRFATTGVLPSDQREGLFVDVSSLGDYRAALEQVRVADEAFKQLNADVRKEFANDPAAFLDAFQTPEGIEKLRKLGVVPEAEEVVLDRQEAAVEARAAKRAEARAVAARVEAAKKPPTV